MVDETTFGIFTVFLTTLFCGVYAYLTIVSAQVVHEIGHYVPAYLCGLNPFFRYEASGIPNGVFYDVDGGNIKNFIVIIGGIILGTIPLIIYAIFSINNISAIIYMIPLSLLYLYGCGKDIADASEILRISG